MEKDSNMFYCGEGIWKAADSKKWMELTGSDPHGIRIMMEKDQIYPIYMTNIYFGAGNILKQDMLSLGGDVVVHKFFVNGKEERGDVLLLGTAKHYRLLQTKMYAQHWGLKELAGDLKILMENLLTYRQAEDLELREGEKNFLQGEKTMEEILAKMPMNRGKTEGFISLPIKKTLDEKMFGQLFYPALSRGYYINE